MSSYRQHLYHIVFRTKESLPTIRQNNAHELYSYITGKLLQDYGITPDEKFFP